MRCIELAQYAATAVGDTVPAPDSQTTIASLYTLIGVVVVAVIGAVVTIITSRWTSNRPASRSNERVAKRAQALELWIALNVEDVDPRRIKTGYETHAEVARAS